MELKAAAVENERFKNKKNSALDKLKPAVACERVENS
jgi:hypothetical protein